MILYMNERKRTEIVNMLLTCMQWGVNFLTVYSLMVVIAGIQVGVGNGFIVLMAGMVWLGCMAADVLLGLKQKRRNDQAEWMAESICMVIVMAVFSPLCGIVAACLYIAEILAKRKWNSRLLLWGGSVVTVVCMSHLVLQQLKTSSSLALGMTVLLLQTVHQRAWLESNPLEYMTLQLHTDREKEKAPVVLMLTCLVSTLCMIALCVLYGRSGLYAVQQKALYRFLEADLWSAGMMSVICFCYCLKDRYSYGDMEERDKTAVPWMQSSLCCVALYSLWLMNCSHLIAGFSMLCLLVLCAVMILVKKYAENTSSSAKILLSVWAMVYMVSVFLLVYNGYDGMRINVIRLGEVAAGCAMIHLQFMRGRGLL